MSFWGPGDRAAPSGGEALTLDATGREEAAQPAFTDLWSPPGPVAERFYWDDGSLVGCRGPVGSGKTRSHMASRLRRAAMAPRSRLDGQRRYKVIFARQTYRQLWQTTIPSWFEVMPRKLGKWAGGRGDPVTHAVELEDEWGVIEFVAEFLAFGENPGEITANLRGVQTSDLALEEADTIDPTVIAVGVTRIGRWPSQEHFRGMDRAVSSWGQVTATYNACDEENPIVGLFEPENAPDPKLTAMRERLERDMAALHAEGALARPFSISFHRQPGGREAEAENLGNLPAGYYATQVATMTAMGRGDEIRRLVDNRLGFVREGTPVFAQEWNPRVHVMAEADAPEPGEALILGFDQGFFGAGVVLTFRRPFQWRVWDEFVDPERLFAEEFAARFREQLEEDWGAHAVVEAWGDMAGDREAAESQESLTWNEIVGTHLGIPIMGQTEGANRIGPRLRAIRAGLDFLHKGQPGLMVHPRCRRLIRGFEARYVWAEETDKAGTKTTKPRKRGIREADLMDALAHAMISRGAPSGVTPVTHAADRERLRRRPDSELTERASENRQDRYDPFSLWRPQGAA